MKRSVDHDAMQRPSRLRILKALEFHQIPVLWRRRSSACF
jgi:hypothetical protein